MFDIQGGPLNVQSGSISLLSGLITDHRVFKFRDPSSFAGSKYLLKIKLSQHSSGKNCIWLNETQIWNISVQNLLPTWKRGRYFSNIQEFKLTVKIKTGH